MIVKLSAGSHHYQQDGKNYARTESKFTDF